jgi:phosphoribosylformylglycinamidine cyclo-ligase
VEIPGGEVCQLPEVLRGHPSPYGFDLVGSAFGIVALDKIVDGSAARPGDAMIGIPASGVHSNGLTLARQALLDEGGLALDATPQSLGGQTVGETLLEPTVIYVKAVLELLRSTIDVHGLAHITGGGLLNLRRIGSGVGYSITAPLPSPPIYELIAHFGEVSPAEMWEVFNMGCGFVVMVPADQAEATVALLEAFHPGTAVIGTLTDQDDLIEVQGMGIRAEKGAEKLTGA